MGIQFLSPLFAAGLLATAIPIVIHMIHRRRTRELPIATLRFLRKIPARTIRRRRLEEYILLAARMLVIALLALGAMRPVLRDAAAAGGATSLALVLDDSYSMDYRVAGIARMQEASEAAAKVFRTLSEGDRAALILASSPGSETLTTDLGGLRRRAGAAETSLLTPNSPGDEFAGLLPACHRAMALLREAPEPNRELVVVTDLQARAVAPVLDKLGEEEGDRSIRVVIVDVGAKDPANAAITKVSAGLGVAVAGEPVRVSATVKNHSAVGASTPVSLAIGDERLAEQRAALKPGETVTVSFEAVAEVPEAATGRVLIGGDALATDDLRHFVLPVLGRVPVLLVNGDPSPIPYQDEGFFLRAALTPEEMGGEVGTSTVNLKVVEPDGLATEDLRPYKTIILANVEAAPPRAVAAIRAFVRSGGGLLFFCGNRVSPDEWNRDLGTDEREGLLPAALSAPTQLGDDPDAVIRLADADHEHELFAGLPPEAVKDLARIHARRVMGADAGPAGGRVVARLDGGAPLIVEKTAGRGRVLLITVSADADWGNLPIRPLFLPLVHRAVMLLAGGPEESRELLVGDSMAVPPPPADAPPPELVDPHGDVRRLGGDGVPGGELTTGPLTIPGVYRVKGSGDGEEIVFAVNADAREGDLTRVGFDAISEHFGPERTETIEGAAGLEPALSSSRKGRPIWGWLLSAALLLLLFEGVFANRIACARAAKDREERE